jgi:hypothetical protein
MKILWYVENANNIMKCKDEFFQKLARIGSCRKTPLEGKARFFIVECKDKAITEVEYYAPWNDFPSQVVELSEPIPSDVWNSAMDVTACYEENHALYEEKERIRGLVRSFEYAAKRHGQMQQAMALGDVDEKSAYESGKLLKTCREELYKELGV